MDGIYFGHIKHKPSSPTLSTFAPSKILPYSDPFGPMGDSGPDEYTINKLPQIDSAAEFGANGNADLQEEELLEREARRRFSTDELTAYDLRPPPPTVSDANAELIAERLYSADHLNIILKDPAHFQRFRSFLNRYRPQSVPILVRYLESQKALTAVRWANALADQISTHSRQSSRSSHTSDAAAIIDLKFENFARRAVDELVTDALPAYITYRMVTVVTECLVKEITGNNTPLMKDLVQGLAEVYCMTDPHQADNPIVFASDEFYNTTQYGREYVMGKNCRFLQGPKTQRAAVKRITHALHNGHEISEILLNYRRDGSPFLNLVMMAPLMDSQGSVRYFIGAQIDISYLLEGGKGLESFKQLLDQERDAIEKTENAHSIEHKPSLKLLRELGGLLNDEEIDVVRHRERRNSSESSASTPTRANLPNRRFVGMDEPVEGGNIWPPSAFGPSGRLPGVYQNYLLVRPYPSLRIIFTSAALRIPGLSQSKLMDRIGGPQHVRDGVLDALSQGVGVTAKISWLTHTSRSNAYNSNDDESTFTNDEQPSNEGRPRWIHCTPLMGSDSKPGVIMIVMVDREEITGALHTQNSSTPRHQRSRSSLRHRDLTKEAWPLRGAWNNGVSANKYTGSKLYADYLRREGRSASREEGRPREEGARMGAVHAGIPHIVDGMASVRSPSVDGRSSVGRSTPSQQRRSASMRKRDGRDTA